MLVNHPTLDYLRSLNCVVAPVELHRLALSYGRAGMQCCAAHAQHLIGVQHAAFVLQVQHQFTIEFFFCLRVDFCDALPEAIKKWLDDEKWQWEAEALKSSQTQRLDVCFF